MRTHQKIALVATSVFLLLPASNFANEDDTWKSEYFAKILVLNHNPLWQNYVDSSPRILSGGGGSVARKKIKMDWNVRLETPFDGFLLGMQFWRQDSVILSPWSDEVFMIYLGGKFLKR